MSYLKGSWQPSSSCTYNLIRQVPGHSLLNNAIQLLEVLPVLGMAPNFLYLTGSELKYENTNTPGHDSRPRWAPD